MPFGEGTAGTRLQIFLEADGVSFIPKLDRNDKRPGPVVHRMTAWPVIVPIEAFVHVLSDADIMTVRLGVAANDVHEALAKVLHEASAGINRAIAKSSKSRRFSGSVSRICNRENGRDAKIYHGV